MGEYHDIKFVFPTSGKCAQCVKFYVDGKQELKDRRSGTMEVHGNDIIYRYLEKMEEEIAPGVPKWETRSLLTNKVERILGDECMVITAENDVFVCNTFKANDMTKKYQAVRMVQRFEPEDGNKEKLPELYIDTVKQDRVISVDELKADGDELLLTYMVFFDDTYTTVAKVNVCAKSIFYVCGKREICYRAENGKVIEV